MNKKNSLQRHEFAFYVSSLKNLISTQSEGSVLRITDEVFFHRISRVIRLVVGDICTLFDEKVHISFEIKQFKGKKHVEGFIGNTIKNVQLKPACAFWLPLLKKEDFQLALYSLVELGVNEIQPIITEKSRQKWGNEKEVMRAFLTMVKAAEQSKNFSLPVLLKTKTLDQCCDAVEHNTKKIFFDPTGKHVSECVKGTKKDHLVLLIGPEGDLTEDEKQLVKKAGFDFCALTPTVLRATQAAVLSVGLFRSFIR